MSRNSFKFPAVPFSSMMGHPYDQVRLYDCAIELLNRRHQVAECHFLFCVNSLEIGENMCFSDL